jgi:hypothetical protein
LGIWHQWRCVYERDGNNLPRPKSGSGTFRLLFS